MEQSEVRTLSTLERIAAIVGGSLSLMWVVEAVDTWALDSSLQTHGIEPRQLDGLEGVIFAHFLHAGWSHLISNSVPYLILGSLVFLSGLKRWAQVTSFVIVVSGIATWLLARSGNHIGASILVFGWFGYLIASGWFERSFKSILIALLVIVLYGGLIAGVVPTDSGISWEGHLFGALAGGAAAWLLNKPATS